MAEERELCPRCASLQPMRVSETIREEGDESGAKKRFRVLSYHCAGCSVFVKSVESPMAPSDAG
ncbi:MAG: hypothetical protein JXA20_01890 [Spirochaetes bacterium]|nr:hypothetical protein [Spirochaetota bacterium]